LVEGLILARDLLEQANHLARRERKKPSFELTPSGAEAQIGLASDAFAGWSAIRKEKIVQDYLLSLRVPGKRG